MSEETHLTEQFDAAVRYARDAHGGQTRKGTDIPYISHPLAVSALVLEAGGSEVQAMAALLHDVAEDCGGQPRLDDMRQCFGDPVADIVEACSDSLVVDSDEKEGWCTRKKRYLDHLRNADEVKEDVLLVSLADKAHNAAAILRDLRDVGVEMFGRFTIGKEQGLEKGRAAQEWYYGQLVDVFESRSDELPPGGKLLLRELRQTVTAICAYEPSPRRHPSEPGRSTTR